MTLDPRRLSAAARALILTTAGGLVIAIVLATSIVDGRWGWSLPIGWKPPGAVAIMLGLGVIGWAEISLLRVAHSTGGFGDPPTRLVVEGPYRFTRNPVYLGAFVLLVGLSLWRGSPTLLAAAVAFLPVMHLFVVRLEEPATRRRLGAAYDDYRRRVPRWLPRPWARSDR
jgi:protein-S-isoprenylcysteine O-methyltransferase Ste14